MSFLFFYFYLYLSQPYLVMWTACIRSDTHVCFYMVIHMVTAPREDQGRNGLITYVNIVPIWTSHYTRPLASFWSSDRTSWRNTVQHMGCQRHRRNGNKSSQVKSTLFGCICWQADKRYPHDCPDISAFFLGRTLMTNCFLVFYTMLRLFLSHFTPHTQHSSNLRDRRHNFVLIEKKNPQLNHRHFIVRLFLMNCVMTSIKRILYIVLY